MNQIQPPPAFTTAQAAKLLGITEDTLRQNQKRKANQLIKGGDFERSADGNQIWWTKAGINKLATLIPSAKLQVDFNNDARVMAFLNGENHSGVTLSLADTPAIDITAIAPERSSSNDVTSTPEQDDFWQLLEGLELNAATIQQVDQALEQNAEVVAWNQLQQQVIPQRMPKLVESILHRILKSPTPTDREKLVYLVQALSQGSTEAMFLSYCHNTHDNTTADATIAVTEMDWIDAALSSLAELVAWRRIYQRLDYLAKQKLQKILAEPTEQESQRFNAACHQIGERLAAVTAAQAAAHAFRNISQPEAVTGNSSLNALPTSTHQGD